MGLAMTGVGVGRSRTCGWDSARKRQVIGGTFEQYNGVRLVDSWIDRLC